MDKPALLIERCNPDLGEGGPFEREVMIAGWIGCINYAAETAEIRDAYKAETGKDFIATFKRRTPIDKMIDQACGFDHEAAKHEAFLDFAEWVTRNLWGRADQEDAS